MNRLLIYLHFNKNNEVSEHVYYQLKKLNPLFSKILFISNSPMDVKSHNKLTQENYVSEILFRENRGYDFAGWRDGLNKITFPILREHDSVTLMNDSCFGPIWDMEPYYLKYEQDAEVDFWGITNNRTSEKFPEHIQSYFICYKKEMVNSTIFKDFWTSIKDYKDIQEVIDQYETQSTKKFVEAGFRYSVLLDTSGLEVLNDLPPDFSLYHPTVLLEHRVPFLKVKVLPTSEGIAPYLLDFIDKNSQYPVDLIVNHLSATYKVDEKYLLGFKYLRDLPYKKLDKSIAIHLHVFYTDLLQEFINSFNHFDFEYDLFITTDSEDKRLEIDRQLKANSLSAKVLVFDNIGRDIIPMLKIKNYLQNYDYIGHFHTKKSKEADFWAGESWRNELITSMIDIGNRIISNLEQPSIGLVIADIPSFFRYNKIVDANNEFLIAPIMNLLWKEMKLQKDIDFERYNTFVMSYGTFVWFKYDALKPLFDFDWDSHEIPEEPLPQNSILHAIERMLVYIAWDQNYDFLISETPKRITPFLDNKQLNMRSGNSLPQSYSDFMNRGGIKQIVKEGLLYNKNVLFFIWKRVLKKIRKK